MGRRGRLGKKKKGGGGGDFPIPFCGGDVLSAPYQL